MYGHRLVDVRRNKIIISRKRTWCSSSRSDRWLFQKTLYRSNVLQFFCIVKRSPNRFVSSYLSHLLSSRAAYHSFRIMGLRQLAGLAATMEQNASTKNANAKRSRMLPASGDEKSCRKTRYQRRLPSYTHISTLTQLNFIYELVRRFHINQSNDVPSTEA